MTKATAIARTCPRCGRRAGIAHKRQSFGTLVICRYAGMGLCDDPGEFRIPNFNRR